MLHIATSLILPYFFNLCFIQNPFFSPLLNDIHFFIFSNHYVYNISCLQYYQQLLVLHTITVVICFIAMMICFIAMMICLLQWWVLHYLMNSLTASVFPHTLWFAIKIFVKYFICCRETCESISGEQHQVTAEEKGFWVELLPVALLSLSTSAAGKAFSLASTLYIWIFLFTLN